MHGKLYQISPRYSLSVWFYETGSVRNISITNRISGQLILDDVFHENGFLQSYQRQTATGMIQEGFLPDGSFYLRKHYKGEFLEKSEYYDKEGKLKNIEYFGDDN